MVSQDRFRFVQQIRDLGLALALQCLLQQVDVVAPAGLDEDLAHGGALCMSATCPLVLLILNRASESSYLVLLLV